MKWEYREATLFVDGSHKGAFDQWGTEGWELVDVSNGIAYFRREKKQPMPVKLGPQETKEAPYV